MGVFLWTTEADAAQVGELLPTCQACHGENEASVNSDVPIIAGQPFTVISDALMLFANGGRPCTSMCAVAATLSPDERAALAAYMERQVFVPARQEFDAGLARRGAALHRNCGCEGCHSQGGENGQGMAPVLSGQKTAYLRNALAQIRSGTRSGPQVMNRSIRALRDQDIEALLNFYASAPVRSAR